MYQNKTVEKIITKYGKNNLASKIYRDRYLFILFLPGLLYFLIFKYLPMFGIVIAFKNYDIFDGFMKSKWVGLNHFTNFFKGPYFWMLIRNTLLLNIYSIIFSFPIPIIFALLLNEIKKSWFKRLTQTVSYLPHFISTVVIVGMIIDFLSPTNGLISIGLSKLTGNEPVFYMAKAEYFRTIYIISGVWQHMGWSSIIYLSALTGVDPILYEAATVDGANRFHKMIHITIPGIIPTIVVCFILNLGSILDVGFEKVFLMQNSLNFENSEVISTFVERIRILQCYARGSSCQRLY